MQKDPFPSRLFAFKNKTTAPPAALELQKRSTAKVNRLKNGRKYV